MPNLSSCTSGFNLLINSIPSPLSQPIQTLGFRGKPVNNLLKSLWESKNLILGEAVHAHLIKDCQFDLIRTNHFINLYAKCGQLEAARRLFDVMPERNIVSGCALMAGYFHSGLPWEALSVFKPMVSGEFCVRPNEYVFSTALASCAGIRALMEGRQCHAYVLKSGLVVHSYVRNALLHMYVKCSSLDDALGVFEMVPEFDIFSLNSMLNSFLEHGRLSDATDVLSGMVKEVVRWDHVTFVTVLGFCADSKDLILGWQVHNQLLKKGIEGGMFIGSSIIDMYGKCGDLGGAERAFHQLSDKNVVSWTSLMTIYVQNGRFEAALKLFLELELDGVRPNEFTFVMALNSCAGLSALRNGDSLNADTEKSGYKAHLIVGNALINMYSKSGSIDYAHKVFIDMPLRDIISWNSIITGYAHHGLGREALEAFDAMLKEGGVPNYVTFVGVLSACAHLGLVDDGFYYLNHYMRNLGIIPGLEHYTCMVGILCRTGQLEEAERFMGYTEMDWDIVAWRTLLSACQMHRNYGLGKLVAEHILQLDPGDVGTYILLSNMYAKANRWDGVVKVRKLMREREIKKEPGVSWIQVQSETHVFASEDKKHPRMKQIHDKVAELLAEIKLLGYVPNISSVLHDVEDEQKEEYLSYHSEKLAIAFGLLRTPLGAPIYVIKNLRMCEDCHIAVKLISNLTKRKIIVRDANRFHNFDCGACSCDDYW